jgi:23S rRNA pseudouridine1911/1915/1917 synthase
MTYNKIKLAVSSELAGERLDIFCARMVADRTRSYFTKLASSGNILIDGRPAKASSKVKTGMKIEIELATPPPMEYLAENIPLKILFEDGRLMVIDKPAGMVVHPAAGNYEGTLVNALLHHLGEASKRNLDPGRLGLVHRLDKDTSGLLVVAKDEMSLTTLQKRLKERKINRVYTAIIWGRMEKQRGTIDLPIGRSEKDRKIMSVNSRHGRQAVTHYEVSERFLVADKLAVTLETGRTHQIRVHLSFFGHPVIGDPTYGGRAKYLKRMNKSDLKIAMPILRLISRQALHASILEFPHPGSGEILKFESQLPDDINSVLTYLRSLS